MREGSSIAATKASAVSWPTPGMVISRRQAAEALVIRLMSASIAATAVITAVRAAIKAPHGGRETSDPLACFKSLVDEGSRERAGQSDPEHDRQASDLIFQGHSLADQLLARDDQRAERRELDSDFTCTGLKKPVRAKCARPRASLRSVLWVASDLSAW